MDMVVRTPKQIGGALKRFRRQRELTQETLGQSTNLRQATISRLEAGEPGTQLRTLTDILATLDLELVIRPRSRASSVEDDF